MNIGSDYLLVRAIQRRQLMRMLSFALIATSVTLLVAGGSYFAYAQYARSGLSSLVYEAPAVSDVVLPGLSVPQETAVALPELSVPQETAIQETATDVSSQPIFIPAARFTTLYPGQGIHPKYWTNPLWAEETNTAALDALLAGFRPIEQTDLAELGTLAPVTRIQIPSINLNAAIEELELLNLGDAYAWETPNNIVGHIPSTANAGEAGRGYLFGHLESPFKGEGSIFRRLPDIPQFLKSGDEVYITLSRADGVAYLYKVVSTEVVHKDDFLIMPSGDEAIVSLVVCVPRLVYSHRLIVNAEPVGIQGL